MADLSKPLRIMKRILIFLLALMPVIASAQKVSRNEIDEKGIRHIETDIRIMNVGRSACGCQLSYIKADNNEAYTFMLAINDQSSRWTAEKGQKLMMKDANGQVYEITSTGTSKSTIGRGNNGITYQTIIAYTIPMDIANIFADGLVKLRIEYTYIDNKETDLLDIDIPADITNYLKKAHKNISKAIPLPAAVDKSSF